MSHKPVQIFLLLCLVLASCVEHSRDAIHQSQISINATEALEYLNDLAEDEPDNPEVFYQLSKIHFDEANYPTALRNIRKAIEVREDNAEYYFMQGQIYQQLNEPESSVSSMLLAESMGKSNNKLYQVIAEEYMRLGESEKARRAIDRLTSMSKSPSSYVLRGNIILALGDTTEAVKNFQQATEADDTYLPAYEALSKISIAKGDEERSFELVDKMLSLSPENIDFLEQKGNLLQRSGQLDSALQVFGIIADKRGEFMDYYKLSNIYYLQNEYDSAKAMAEIAFDKNDEFLEAQLIIARSLDKRRRYNESIEVYELIIAADSTFNLAATELENLKRKVAYLWRLEQQRKARDSAINNAPPPVRKKELDDN